MSDLKQIVAANLIAMRKEHGLTQMQLAETLHYSDKAVSKWERGESLPDLLVMKRIADLYQVRLDDFVTNPEERTPREEVMAESELPVQQLSQQHATSNKNRVIIAGMAGVLVWLIVTMTFVVMDIFVPDLKYTPLMFIYAIPMTAVVWLVFNSVWFNRRLNYVIISILVWTTLGGLYVSFYENNWWQLFVIGIPAQVIIMLWSRLRPNAPERSHPPDETDESQTK